MNNSFNNLTFLFLKKSGSILTLLFLFLFFIFVNINSASAAELGVGYNSDLPKVILNNTPPSAGGTYSNSTMANDTYYWQGHIWSEVSRWLYNMTIPANVYTDAAIALNSIWNQTANFIYQANLSGQLELEPILQQGC